MLAPCVHSTFWACACAWSGLMSVFSHLQKETSSAGTLQINANMQQWGYGKA